MNDNENKMPDDLESNVKGEQDENQTVDQSVETQNDSTSEPAVDTSSTKKVDNGNEPNFAKKTLSESVSRFGSTGQVRAAIFAGVGVITLAAGGLYWALTSGEEKLVEAGTVVMPTTNATAPATVTSEQAAHIKAQQEQQAADAAMRGDTYIAAILTEREEKSELTGNPTQPGIVGKDSKTGNIETPNGTMSPAQVRFMETRGFDQQPMNTARTDTPQNVYGQPVNNTSKPNQQNTNAQNSGQSGQQPPNNFYQVQPHQSTTTNSSDSASSELANENEELTKAKADVEKWQNDYAQLRLKKAEAVDKKTQLAFEAQIKGLTASKVNHLTDGKNKTYQTYRFTTNSQKYDQFGNPIDSAETNAGVGFNATAPKTQDIHGNGYVEGQSSIVTEANQKPLVRAGDTARAILTTGVNTDEGNEVAAKIQSGALKGATVLGTVHVTNDNIQFRFTRLLRKDKEELGITAVARQLGTNKSGMADDVKKHYVQRYTALAASSALSGYGKAYEQTAGQNATVSGSGTVVTQTTDPSNDRIMGNVIGELGTEISDEVKKNANRKPTYITNNGKVFNLFFNQSVLEKSVAGSVSTNVKR